MNDHLERAPTPPLLKSLAVKSLERLFIQYVSINYAEFIRRLNPRFATIPVIDEGFERIFLTMARKTTNRERFSLPEITFVDYRLSLEDKKGYEAWSVKVGEKWLEELAELLLDGWKMSQTWDGHNECFIASATNRDEASQNHNKCVTSRSDELWDAIRLNVYKIVVIWDNQDIPTDKRRENWG